VATVGAAGFLVAGPATVRAAPKLAAPTLEGGVLLVSFSCTEHPSGSVREPRTNQFLNKR